MSWHMKLKLPSFKLTRRCGDSAVEQNVSRGIASQTSVQESPVAGSEYEEDGAFGVNDISESEDFQAVPEPSLHAIKQKSTVLAWEGVRAALRTAAVQCSAMPIGQECILCSELAEYRCLECAAWAFYCSECFGNVHSKVGIFHTGEIWQDGMFKPIVIQGRTIDVRQHHCDSVLSAPLCCIDVNGTEHEVNFQYCSCEPLVVTLVRARLWPSTPCQPKLAFTFDLFDWAEALLLECQVALKDLCKAFQIKCPHLVTKRKNIYSAMIDSFEEYQYLKVELRHLSFLSEELDGGNVCPACPVDSSSLILSVDALFGLPRKKSAGCSYRDALHGNLFFGDQQLVDEFVQNYEMGKKPLKACSDFLAGDVLRSSKRYHALDETAIFGCACRHEFPHLFINLKHGEKLSYGVWLVNQIVNGNPDSVKLHIMYDIACMLVQHLKLRDSNLLQKVTFSLPSFHAYGHKPACQVLYSPLRCNGIGLSDGEVMERLWSYMRRFTRMTKEMRPSHRIDVLSHALLFYGHCSKQKLPSLLLHRWKKATEMNAVANADYMAHKSAVKGEVSDDLVEKWIEDEKYLICDQKPEPSIIEEWKTHYFFMLQSFYLVRDNLTGCIPSQREALRGKVFSMDHQLADFEHRHNIRGRWASTDPCYLEAQKAFFSEKKEQLQASLWAAVVKRHYLLRMKAKYAEGQKIAKKLSSGIAKEMRKLNSILEEFNVTCSQLDIEHTYSLSEVLSPDSDFWSVSTTKAVQGIVPWSMQRNICQAFLTVKRTEEEVCLLQEEMKQVIKYWKAHQEKLRCLIEKYECEDDFNRGAKALLHKLLWEADMNLSKATAAFSPILLSELSTIPISESEEESDDDSDDCNDTEL